MWWSTSSRRQASVQKKTPKAPRRKALMMVLEPRYMFDGAVAATHAEGAHHLQADGDHDVAHDHLQKAAVAQTPAASSGPAVIFVDSRVTNASTLLNGVAAGTEVVYLNASEDGLQQIATYLAAHHEVGSVEIIAHGSDADLLLGSTNLRSANINSYAQELGAIGSNLKHGADILIYACDTAADAQGVAFVDTLANLTGHHIAASTNVTGAAGDWTLKFQTGDITAVPVLSAASEAAYADNLGLDVVTQSGDDLTTQGTLRYEINNSHSGDIIYFSGVSTVTLSIGMSLVIQHDLTIESDLAGDGSNPVTIDANHTSGVMYISGLSAGATVKLIGLTFKNGLLSGNGGSFNSFQPGSAEGAGLFVDNNAIVSLNQVYFSNNDATGGGGQGRGTTGTSSVVYSGGGGSGVAGVGGGFGGTFAAGPNYSALKGSGGNGGDGRSIQPQYTNYVGKGGTTTGGAGGKAAYSGGRYYAAGGNGATAGNIGGGGGGSGLNPGVSSQPTSAGNGGIAVGGLYINTGATVYIANSKFTKNYGAGGGGGGNYNGNGAGGGDGVGAIRVAAGARLVYSGLTFSSNIGAGGQGGSSNSGSHYSSYGSSGATGASVNGIQNLGSVSSIASATPTVTSIVRAAGSSSINNNSSEAFTVTFSEGVTGVTASDFTVTPTGTVAHTGITVTQVSSSVYTITVNGVTGAGTMRLDLNSSGTAIESKGFNVAIASGYTSAQSYLLPPVVSSVGVPSTGTYASGQTLDFTVNFNEAVTVTGTPELPITLATGGTVDATYVSGSGTSVLTFSYTLVDGEQASSGIVMGSALLLNGGTIKDSSADSAVLTLNNVPTTTGVVVQALGPVLSSIDIAGISYTNGSSESFTVTYSEAMNAATVLASDFAVHVVSGSLTDTGITVAEVDASHYTVTVNGVSGNGVMRLDMNAGNSEKDASGNGLSTGHTGDETYTVDQTPPTVSSIALAGANPTNGSSESFTVTFSESVTGVNASDFTVVNGGATDTGITSITGSGSIYTVTVGGVGGNGTLGLNLNSSGTGIEDLAGNALAGGLTGSVYTINTTHPMVSSITAVDALTNNASSEQFAVTFSEAVSGLTAADFQLATTNTNGATALTTGGITSITGSGSSYVVTVGSIAGDGTLRLDLNANSSGISDTAGNTAIAGFTSGSVYTIEHTAPVVSAIAATGNTTNNASTETFTVTFSESITGLSASNFGVNLTGTANYAGLTLTPMSGSQYQVTLNGVSGDGTLQLNFNHSAANVTDVASNQVNADFNSGAIYTVEHTAPVVTSVGVPSNSTYIAGQNLDFTVNFSEAVSVTGGPELGITLNTGGKVYAQYLSGSGSSTLTFRYTVVDGETTTNGVVLDAALTANGGTIQDAATNVATLSLNNVAATRGVQVYSILPTATAIDIAGASLNNASTETYNVTFSAPVTGVDVSDFTLISSGTASGVISSVTGSGSSWAVTVGGVTGDGTLRLDLNNVGEHISDSHGNILTAAHTGDQRYTVEHTLPVVSSIIATGSATNNASTETFTVSFSESVSGLSTSNFGANLTGTANYTGLTLTPVSGSQYQVTLNGVAGDGTLQLRFNHSAANVADAAGNLVSADVNSGTAYTIEHTAPVVTSVGVPGNSTYVAGQNLDFTVNFSEAVNVTGDPELGITLNTGGKVYAQYLSGSGSSTLSFRYTVLAGEAATNGIALDAAITANSGTIHDAATNNATLSFNSVASTSGVHVDSVLPTATAINIVGNSANNANTETYNVTFSKPVTGVDASDFTLVSSGTASGAISSVSGSGTNWTVTVGNVTGDGNLRLDLNNTGDHISDSYSNILTAAHTGDQRYAVEHTPPSITAMSVPANGTYGTGEAMNFTVSFSENVIVNTRSGTPRIAITLDAGSTVYANYVSGSGTGALTFRYLPTIGDKDLNGIVTGTVIETNGGTIKDAASNLAALTISAVEPSTVGIDVDALPPVVVPVTSGGRGRGILPGNGGDASHTVVVPPVWVPGEIDHAQQDANLPRAAQVNWAPAPLITLGQQSNVQNMGNSGDQGALNAGVNLHISTTPIVDAIINPQVSGLHFDGNPHFDAAQSFELEITSDLLLHDANTAALSAELTDAMALLKPVDHRAINQAEHQAAKLTPLKLANTHDQQFLPELTLSEPDLMSAHRLSDSLLSPTVPANAARHPTAASGKLSLNQQFTRYGQKAWEREKAVLLDNAHRSAQRRTG